jgi:DNA processing protein
MVALLRTGRRPWVEYAEMVEHHGSAAEALQHELGAASAPGAQISLLEPEKPTADALTELVDAARADIERWDSEGVRLVTVLDPEYPPNLRAVHDRPPMLFIRGLLTPQDANAVAVVGARTATSTGMSQASAIAQHLVERNFTVVSGLAAGIDTAGHTAALAAKGRTVAVIGTGLARFYPPQNEALQRDIARRCAVVSQFWPDAPPTRRSFPMRNAVMSGIALATVVVEAAHTSGARMQARLALAQGRPVFLTRELVHRQAWAQQAATRPGTHVVDDPREITTALERLISPGSLVA